MLRRAFLNLVPALLALACLCGTSSTSVGGPEASTPSWSTGAAAAPVARGSLTQDVPDIAVNQTADEDDPPHACIARAVIPIFWPDTALQTRALHASNRTGDRHRPCAAPPRAPPTA